MKRKASSSLTNQPKMTEFIGKELSNPMQEKLKKLKTTQRIEKFLLFTPRPKNNDVQEVIELCSSSSSTCSTTTSSTSNKTAAGHSSSAELSNAKTAALSRSPPPHVKGNDSKTNAFSVLMEGAAAVAANKSSSAQLSRVSSSTSSSSSSNTNKNDEETNEEVKKGMKKVKECPFYKWIPDSQVTVDAFNFGEIPNCQAYFLSHFHYDHYIGLTKHFRGNIFCSQITANLVLKKIHVPLAQVHPLPMETPVQVADLTVTLLDANHCPGSVMFLCENNRGRKRVHLHTGDFRADPTDLISLCKALHLAIESPLGIDTLLLDTTYCDPLYNFPSQRQVIQETLKFIQENITSDTLLVFGSYLIGKERIFMAVAEALDLKIAALKEKQETLHCLEWPALTRRLTLQWNSAQIHVLPMKHIQSIKSLSEHLARINAGQRNSSGSSSPWKKIMAFKPTGWTFHGETDKFVNSIQTSENINIYGVAYSEHSSFYELKEFVKYVKPKRILPTVNNGNAFERQKMQEYFKLWLAGVS